MTVLGAVWLFTAIVTLAPDPPKPPAGWQQKYDAAEKAEKSGDRANAESLLVGVVRDAEKFGADDLRLAEPLERLAGVYIAGPPGRGIQAEELLRRALAIREKAQGPEHPDVADCLMALAMCRLGEKTKSVEAERAMLQRVLAIVEKSKGKEDPEVARVLHNTAVWHVMHREYAAAESELTRALAIREKPLGSENREVADLLDDLGDVHAGQHAFLFNWMAARHRMKAEMYYNRALTIREKVLKPGDPDIAKSLYNLGQFALVLKKPADAERYLRRWLALAEDAKAPASKTQAKVWELLAGASVQRKDLVESDRRLAKAQAVLENVDGAGSEKVADMLAYRAQVALLAERYDDAQRFLERGMATESARLGPGDPDVVEANALLAAPPADRAGGHKGVLVWQRVRNVGARARFRNGHKTLGLVLENYADLLQRTQPHRTTASPVNRIASKPTG